MLKLDSLSHSTKALILLLLAATLILTGCRSSQTGPSTQQQPLRVGLVPNQSPDKIKAQYEPFRTYLANKLGQPVELFVATDYAAVVEAMASDKLDIAYFGGLTYVQAKQRAEIYPIVTEVDRYTHTTKYHSLIIVPADSPIKTVAELKGRTFAFGDINSTSGSLYPRIMLDKAGIRVPSDLKQAVFTGGHDATALAVQNGTVDAGGIEDRIFYTLLEKGTVDKNKVRVLAESDLIEGYPWVARTSLDQKLVEKITTAFLEMKDADLLKLMRAEGYAKVTKDNYRTVEDEALRLGLLRK